MNKKFEYVDDNPGTYFGMLVESVEDKKKLNEDNESLKEDYDKRLVQKLYSMWFSKEQAEWLAKNAKDYAESLAYGHTTTDDLIEAEEYVNSKMKKQEAIKEDKKLNEQSKYLPTNSSGIINLKKVIKELESKFTHLLKRRLNGESQIQIFPKEHVETNAFGQEYVDRISLIGPDDETVILSLATDPNDEYCVLYRFPELNKKWKKARTVVELFNAIVDKVVNSTNESLKEDKFVSRDKMSKKDRKELDSQKRNTWGNTKPVTRVQPNKKAYDRKRDKKVVDEDIENKDSEEYLGVDEVKRFVNAREKLLDISDSMTTDLRLGRISREDVLYYRNEIKEIYSFLNSLYFGR